MFNFQNLLDIILQLLQALRRPFQRVGVLAEREARVGLADFGVFFAVELEDTIKSCAQTKKHNNMTAKEFSSGEMLLLMLQRLADWSRRHLMGEHHSL